jgi:hypothetical protein
MSMSTEIAKNREQKREKTLGIRYQIRSYFLGDFPLDSSKISVNSRSERVISAQIFR